MEREQGGYLLKNGKNGGLFVSLCQPIFCDKDASLMPETERALRVRCLQCKNSLRDGVGGHMNKGDWCQN